MYIPCESRVTKMLTLIRWAFSFGVLSADLPPKNGNFTGWQLPSLGRKLKKGRH